MQNRFAFAVAGVVAFASLASASPTVNAVFTGTGAGQNVKIEFGTTTMNVFAGQLKHTLSNASAGYSWINGNHITYCTDLNQVVANTSRTFTIAQVQDAPGNAAMGTLKADALRALYAWGGTQAITTTNNTFAAAFQLAVWEIYMDYSPSMTLNAASFTSGSFKARQTNGNALTSTLVNQAVSIYSGAMTAMNTNNVSSNLVAIISPTAQDQLVVIPTPGTAALAGLGGLLLMRRRR